MLAGSQFLALGLSIVALLVSGEFSFYHTSAKFLGIVCTLVVASFLVTQREIPFYTAQSKKISISILLALFCTLVSMAVAHVGEPVTGICLILMWGLIAFSVSAFCRQEGSDLFIKNLLVYQVPIIVCTFFTFLYHELFVKTFVRPFFGNPNVASNFIALSVLQLLLLIPVIKQKTYRYGLGVFCLIGVYLLYSHGSRAPTLGLILGIIVIVVFHFEKPSSSFFLKNKVLLLTAAILLVSAGGFWFFKKGSASMEIRYSFWRNTLCLIQDHPLGVGPGSFEYVFQHYNGRCYPAAEAGEGLLVRNPHNMFLEFVAEIGIVGALALFAFLFFVGLEVYKNRKKHALASTWVFSLSALLCGIAFFEFPQDTPYTFFFISIIMGVALAQLDARKNLRSRYLAFINLAASIVVAAIFFIKAYSDHLTLHPGVNKKDSYSLACSLNKENWRACVFLGLSYVEENDFEKAEALVRRISKKFEGHHSLMHLRGTLADKKGDFKTACDEFRKYHLLFNQNSSKKEYLEAHCSQQ